MNTPSIADRHRSDFHAAFLADTGIDPDQPMSEEECEIFEQYVLAHYDADGLDAYEVMRAEIRDSPEVAETGYKPDRNFDFPF